jgi:DNA replication and repair protein RecF
LKIELLTAAGVRNLAPLELEPRSRFNVFVGDNGQGKTNLLEAIYVVAALRSFRTGRLAELIAFGQPAARIGARVEKHGLVRVYEVELAPAARKVRLDGKPARPLERYFGAFNVVVFTPEDLALARSSPGDRRRFLDRAAFNRDPSHLVFVQDYERVLKQRNAVLRQTNDGSLPRARADDMLDVYDAQLAELGAKLVASRRALVDHLDGEIAGAFAAITRTPYRVATRYTTNLDRTPELIVAQLRDSRARDFATGATQVGPHRDDLIFELDGRAAGAFASQGQLRAIMLAWKTAELALLTRLHGDPPILLLDDVSSELDPSRNAYLFEHLAAQASQCFITTTHEGHVLLSRDRADYRIRNGQISS